MTSAAENALQQWRLGKQISNDETEIKSILQNQLSNFPQGFKATWEFREIIDWPWVLGWLGKIGHLSNHYRLRIERWNFGWSVVVWVNDVHYGHYMYLWETQKFDCRDSRKKFPTVLWVLRKFFGDPDDGILLPAVTPDDLSECGS